MLLEEENPSIDTPNEISLRKFKYKYLLAALREIKIVSGVDAGIG
jgi:hypothetical protein